MQERIKQICKESVEVKEVAFEKNADVIQKVSEKIIECFNNGNKLLLFGNGGSAADSQHIAAEMIGRFQKERKSLPAVALTTDSSILTALGNDYSFDIIFARQIEGLAKEGDIAFGISTSGNSKNVVKGLEKAKEMGVNTMSLTGGDGGKIAQLSDLGIVVPSKITARVQESHITIVHAICELVEDQFSK